MAEEDYAMKMSILLDTLRMGIENFSREVENCDIKQTDMASEGIGITLGHIDTVLILNKKNKEPKVSSLQKKEFDSLLEKLKEARGKLSGCECKKKY